MYNKDSKWLNLIYQNANQNAQMSFVREKGITNILS